jgi:hypothetical protein
MSAPIVDDGRSRSRPYDATDATTRPMARRARIAHQADTYVL